MDATKKPLRIPPEFATYAEEHEIFDMYKRMLSQLIIEKPVEPLQFLIDWLKRDNNEVPKIAVIGPPASGKSGISSSLTKKINCVLVNQELLLDDELSEEAQEAQKLISSSNPVPDSIWIKLITERLKRKDCLRRGYILDGFPQTRIQAIELQAAGILLRHVVVLEADDTVLIERQAGKRIDPLTGDIYHTTFDWPQDPIIQSRLLEPTGISETDMKIRLNDYKRHAQSIVATHPTRHKIVNADQPKADVLAQTLTYINTLQRSEAPRTPRILLIGPTGSGKSTMAKRLAERYRIVNVSCGTLLKEEVANESKLGTAVKEHVSVGQRVPDYLVSKIIVDRLSQLDATTGGWVLHGFPLNRNQAEQLNDAGLRPNRVFFLDLPDDCVIERLCYRLTDPVSGERYHALYNPPGSAEIKQRCAQHPSDAEDEVQRSLQEYHTFAEELTDAYMDEGAVRVNADQDPQTVYEYLESILVDPLPNNLGKD